MSDAVIKPKWKAYYWQYDDGTYTAAVFQEQPGKMYQRIPCEVYFKDKDQLETELDKASRNAEARNYAFDRKELKIKCGLRYLSEFDLFDLDGKNKKCGQRGWKSLLRFLDSCGTDTENKREVLRLFSGVLSGYCAQMLVPKTQKRCPTSIQDRAPVLVLNSDKKTFNVTYDFISNAMQALTVHTYTLGKIDFKCPRRLPKHLGEKRLDQCAFLRYRKERYPAQYRDTAVLIYGRFFPSNEIYRFIERNRWAVCVLFDAPPKAYEVPAIRLKASSLACSDFDWDTKDINYLIKQFVLWLSELRGKKNLKKQIKKRSKRILKCFKKYYSQKGIQRFNPSENYFMLLQMLTLQLFLDCCVDEKIIDKDKRKKFQADWFNLMLPGCSEYLKSDSKTMTEEMQQEENYAKSAIEKAMCKMLTEENLCYFPYVGEEDDCEETDPEDPSFTYWGYLRWYEPKNKKGEEKKPPFWALVFREDKFYEIVRTFQEKNDNPNDLIKNLRSCGIEYFWNTQKYRFLKGENSEYALIFVSEKMDFLSEETRVALLAKLPDSAKEGK